LAILLTIPAFGTATGDVKALQQVKSWGYQLQAREGNRLDLGALQKSPFDLLVIDYADGDRPLLARDVDRVRQRPNDAGRRILLAYMSIGEAEDYRFYWKAPWKSRPPAFLARSNPDWKGNYKVRYWDPAWQSILTDYLDRIIDAGFDGVYLDIIDAFEFFGPGGEMFERKTAAEDMRALVVKLAGYAREKRQKQDFFIVPQNGANILDGLSDQDAKPYLDAVDAIGVEDTFFSDDELKVHGGVIKRLERFQKAGKPVFAVDYVKNLESARKFVRLAKKHGFIPYVGARELDRLVQQPDARRPE
jgi:cysteinyl-tRNA synthetase